MKKIRFLQPMISHTEEFERALARYLGVKYCVCVNSGTSALILSCKALELSGDVIVPSFTFSGTVHALSWNGLVPKFTDIDHSTFNLDPAAVERNITSRTSAILAVHMYGNPCDIRALEKIARKRHLKLFFDSAHAFGSRYEGRRTGGFGDLEIFSFQAQKILNCAEGGAITTDSPSLYHQLRFLRSQGNRGDGSCLWVGMNARMHPGAAILGLKALKTIDRQIAGRQFLGRYYRLLLSKIPGVILQAVTEKSSGNYQYMPILIDRRTFGISRDQLAARLLVQGIEARKYFHPPVHRFPCYQKIKTKMSLKNTEFVSKHILCLPFSGSMRPAVIKRVCREISRACKIA